MLAGKGMKALAVRLRRPQAGSPDAGQRGFSG